MRVRMLGVALAVVLAGCRAHRVAAPPRVAVTPAPPPRVAVLPFRVARGPDGRLVAPGDAGAAFARGLTARLAGAGIHVVDADLVLRGTPTDARAERADEARVASAVAAALGATRAVFGSVS